MAPSERFVYTPIAIVSALLATSASAPAEFVVSRPPASQAAAVPYVPAPAAATAPPALTVTFAAPSAVFVANISTPPLTTVPPA